MENPPYKLLAAAEYQLFTIAKAYLHVAMANDEAISLTALCDPCCSRTLITADTLELLHLTPSDEALSALITLNGQVLNSIDSSDVTISLDGMTS